MSILTALIMMDAVMMNMLTMMSMLGLGSVVMMCECMLSNVAHTLITKSVMTVCFVRFVCLLRSMQAHMKAAGSTMLAHIR